MRLIDADALKEEVNKKKVVGRFNTLLLIDKAPTVCGNNPKWCESCVSKGKCASTGQQGEWKCPECGERLFACPNCGADLRGEEE